MKKSLIPSLAIFALISGCATMQEYSTPEVAAGAEVTLPNDYPTRDRVDYVLECVAKHGGLSYINQYACGCKIDKIAEKLNFEDYESARTYTQMQKTPGEAGAAFRDPKQSKDLRTRLKEADAEAEQACFVK
jgi:hypothetical protein